MPRVGLLFNHAEIVGGGEISFLELAAALRLSRHEPVALAPGAGMVADRLRGMSVETHVCPLPPIRPATAIRAFRQCGALARQLRNLRLSLAHVNGARAMLYAGPAARRAGIPCLWHVRVLERDRLLDRVRGRYASAIVANSRAVAASLQRYVPADKPAHVVYNGLDLKRWREAEPAALHSFGLPAGAAVILAVGRLSRWKGFSDLIEACAELRRSGLKAACLVAGAADSAEPEHASELREQANAAGMADAFVLAGWREDVPSLMKSAAVAVLPSHGESFGRVIVEAWAAGAPIVATAGGGPAELISDGETGLLVPAGRPDALAAALRRVLENPALACRLKEAGLRRAEDFSIARHAAEMENIYDLLERRPPTRRQ